VAARSGLDHEVLVETERTHVAEAFGVIHQRGPVGEDGVVDREP